MKKKKLFGMLLAVMTMMVFSLTSFAASGSTAYVEGQLVRWGTNGTKATTWGINGNTRTYVSLTEEYMSSAGNTYVSSPVVKTGGSKAEVTYTPNGTFMSAWSYHGIAGKDLTLYL
ncbi:hypothetical protein [Fusibacillus kribbianus]|uniref:Uncharacterized protein n=1 Tax=Fusibacillus kribbianus TaxID=3044208 RepID=A0AAP4BA08_9FIRM|nr:hypothetical protein [Ruminococcus sp. YH-rum2234]MDI9242240.1 hypothetical protein [Ruminococcus sp. YH-rum2234]